MGWKKINSVSCLEYSSEQMGSGSRWAHSNNVALIMFITSKMKRHCMNYELKIIWYQMQEVWINKI